MEKIKGRLEEAIERAQEKLNYESAHDEDIRRSLEIVSDFIKRKQRVCYGGTAMNAILPASKKFYDYDFDLPDYDFYTPDGNGDIEELAKELKAAGFKDVHHRLGIHEGTKKIMVNFVAVADVTQIDRDLFNIFLRRSIVKEGVHYTDPDILRMMMYLELSRPKGQVDRWEKVFDRLQLINNSFPVKATKSCRAGTEPLPRHAYYAVLNYIIENERILCNGPIIPIYTKGIKKGKAYYDVRPGGPMLFTSPAAKEDAIQLKKLIEHKEDGEYPVKIYLHKARGELVPERYELQSGGKVVCSIVNEVACHSYNVVPLKDGRVVYIASLEFLITLYLSLHIFTTRSNDILGDNVMCQVGKFIALAFDNYYSSKSQFPAFSLNCRGHQTGYASLIRKKVLRIKLEKGEGAKPKAATKKKGATKKKRKTARKKKKAD